MLKIVNNKVYKLNVLILKKLELVIYINSKTLNKKQNKYKLKINLYK